ncbi:MAG: hypothetical protein ACTSW1_01480 [Candidatus Hodarchaeales archaeon]
MASQYITFMIIFTLGLSLVIITNNMFLTLSDQFGTNLAKLEMKQILEFLQLQVQRNLLLGNDNNRSFTQQFELPVLLGQKFRYTIEIYNSSTNDIEIHGFTYNNEINEITAFSIPQRYAISIADSKFQSINNVITLSITQINKNLSIRIS